MGSVVVVHWLSCSGRGMQNLPGLGIEPVSPALAGGLPSTAPQRKSALNFLTKNKTEIVWLTES